MSDDEEEFEEQLRQEKLEAERSAESKEVIEHGRVKVDEDGTEFEWDAQQKAWFPKVYNSCWFHGHFTNILTTLRSRSQTVACC